MSTPLAVFDRLEAPVTVAGIIHKVRLYVVPTPSADSTGFDLVDRLVGTGMGMASCIDAWLGLYAPILSAATSAFGNVALQHLVGGAWLNTVFYTPTVAPSSGAGFVAGTQATLSLRDTASHKVRNILLEAVAAVPQKWSSVASMPGGINTWASGFSVPSIFAARLPWAWARGRSGLFIGSLVSVVLADNDRVRRRRGLA